MGRNLPGKSRTEAGQVGKFIVAIIVLVPLLAFIMEVLKPGSVFSFIAGNWIWGFVIVAIIVAIAAVKNKLEGSTV
ncbi:MAG: hypothetical protein HYT72_04445 [Candidatus Aenigmarchaeota archaeon]|nr:hypothetical protein [Candidatus Aenigmarchaeota archaeon]